MIIELIQSDYYEELGKTNFAKDLREDNNEDLDWIYESRYRRGFVVDVGGFVVDVGGVGGGVFGHIGGVGGGVGDFVVGIGGIGSVIGVGDNYNL